MSDRNKDGESKIFTSDPRELVYIGDSSGDEIDLGRFMLNVIHEWRAFMLCMFIGLGLSILAANFLSKTYLVESVVRAPYINELGLLVDHPLSQVSPSLALQKFVDAITIPKTQLLVFKHSGLFKQYSVESDADAENYFRSVEASFSINRLKHDYYELDKDEKTPFKEIIFSLETKKPKLAAEYLSSLIEQAQSLALSELSRDLIAIKKNKVAQIEGEFENLTQAIRKSRKAMVLRLEETNSEAIVKLQQEIDLRIHKAQLDRKNQIVNLEEALQTSQALSIIEPVTWDDLRTRRDISQINNEFGGKIQGDPLYFRGARLLSAELKRLISRESDIPFIGDISQKEMEISALKNDPKVAALKARTNDQIYIEGYDDLNKQLASLIDLPVDFPSAKLAVVSKAATVPPESIRSPILIVLVGLILSGFISLVIVIIRIAIRNSSSDNT